MNLPEKWKQIEIKAQDAARDPKMLKTFLKAIMEIQNGVINRLREIGEREFPHILPSVAKTVSEQTERIQYLSEWVMKLANRLTALEQGPDLSGGPEKCRGCAWYVGRPDNPLVESGFCRKLQLSSVRPGDAACPEGVKRPT